MIEETGARDELIAELENFGIVQPEKRDGKTRLRRDRPRDRPRRQRALALRRRRPQPARLQDLRRPRGHPARAAARARRCARATRSGARRRSRTSRASRRPSATSSTCCWCATSAASPATERPAPMPRVTRRRTIAAPAERGLGAGLRPLQPAALVAAHEPRRERRPQARRAGAASGPRCWRRPRGAGVRADYRCLSSAEGERYVWEQQLDRHAPSSGTCAARWSRSACERRRRAPRSASPPSRSCAACRGWARR